jgi:hypothetical protein
MKRISAILPLTIVLSLCAINLVAQESVEGADKESVKSSFTDEKLSLYGYAVDYVGVELEDDPSSATALGNILYLRLKSDFKPQDGLFFHIEGVYGARTGNQNSFILARSYGLADPDSPSYVQELKVDHAWGSAIFGDFSLQFGKIPIGWGSAYVFNPTQRASRPVFLDPVIDETPGTLALIPTWSPSDALRLSGYVAFQDKSLRDEVALNDGAWDNLPFAQRVQTTVGNFDLTASLIKEVEYIEDPVAGSAEYRRSWYTGLDCAGAVWNFGVYAEAALRLPTDSRGHDWEGDDFKFKDALEIATGFDYSFSDIDLELRVEYYHQGPGESDSDSYNVLAVLSGEKLVQAEDYLYCRAEKVFADFFTLTLGGLVNLNDGSAALFPEFAYEARDNIKFQVGAGIPLGPKGSEFDGRYDLGAGEFDIMKATAFASCKLSF